MNQVTAIELNQMKDKSPQEAAGVDGMDDEYSEFNNEEYRMRNVRLRPQSGVTEAQEK